MGLLGGLVAACFVGAETMGLPCEQDADCGPKLTCHPSGCCGEPCAADTTATTATTTTTTATGSSTSITTATTDPDTGSSDDTAGAECGDGAVNGDEECDLGEAMNGVEWGECRADCRRPLFYWTGADEGDRWCLEMDDCTMQWRNPDGPYLSGLYPGGDPAEGDPVVFFLKSEWFRIDEEAMSGGVELRLDHGHHFNVCNAAGPTHFYDGARVLLEFMDGPTIHVLPFGDAGPTANRLRCDDWKDPALCPIACDGCIMDKPPTEELYFVGDSMGGVTQRRVFNLNRVGMARVVLEVGYDAFNCDETASDPDAWRIDAVHLRRLPPG